MKLSVLIPAYNEIETINEILTIIKSVSLSLKLEIIIVDDGSTDGTREYLKEVEDSDIKVFFHSKNYGKGKAIRTAF